MSKRRLNSNQNIRDRKWDEAEGLCSYCGDKLGGVWHLDHVHPISKGGPDATRNLLPACKTCNLSKGNKPLEQWRRYGQRFHFERMGRTTYTPPAPKPKRKPRPATPLPSTPTPKRDYAQQLWSPTQGTNNFCTECGLQIPTSNRHYCTNCGTGLPTSTKVATMVAKAKVATRVVAPKPGPRPGTTRCIDCGKVMWGKQQHKQLCGSCTYRRTLNTKTAPRTYSPAQEQVAWTRKERREYKAWTKKPSLLAGIGSFIATTLFGVGIMLAALTAIAAAIGGFALIMTLAGG